MYPAVHHDPNKLANVTFRVRGEYKRMTIQAADRKDAIAMTRATYPNATNISVVFFVKSTNGDV